MPWWVPYPPLMKEAARQMSLRMSVVGRNIEPDGSETLTRRPTCQTAHCPSCHQGTRQHADSVEGQHASFCVGSGPL